MIPGNTPSAPPKFVILAAIDDSVAAEPVVAQAKSLWASHPDAELHMVHVVETLPGAALVMGGSPLALPSAAALLEQGRLLLERAANVPGEGDRSIRTHLLTGGAWRAVTRLAEDLRADVLVVGTRDHHGLSRLVARSLTDAIVHFAPCAVLVARAKHVVV